MRFFPQTKGISLSGRRAAKGKRSVRWTWIGATRLLSRFSLGMPSSAGYQGLFFFSLSLLQLRENTPRLESEDASLALITVAHWWSSVEPAFAHRISTGSSGAVPLN